MSLRLSAGLCLSLSQAFKLESQLYYDAEEEVHLEEEVQPESSSSAACTSACECEAEHESETGDRSC